MHKRNAGVANALATPLAQKRLGVEKAPITDLPLLPFKIFKSTEQQLWLVASAHGDLHGLLPHQCQRIDSSEPPAFLLSCAAARPGGTEWPFVPFTSRTKAGSRGRRTGTAKQPHGLPRH